MKILLTNHALKRFGGSESYTFTLAKELSKYHEVSIYTPEPGPVAKFFSDFSEIVENPSCNYDFVIYFHNNTILPNLKSIPQIYTINGIFPKLEQPPAGMTKYVAISKEIADHFKDLSPSIILNGIDTTKYKPNEKKDNNKKNVLFSSHYKSNISRLIKYACLSLGLNFRRIGSADTKRTDVREDLHWADIVIGLGRTAMEALSSGKKVIVADKRSYANIGMDGLLTKDNVARSCNNNYSGRAFKKRINIFLIRKELKKAIEDNTCWERDWICENHDITKIAQKYIDLIIKNK